MTHYILNTLPKLSVLSLAISLLTGNAFAESAKNTSKNVELDEMTVTTNKEKKSDNWLTERSSDKPVQQRTQLGRLTKTTPIAGSIVDAKEIENVKYADILREQLNRVPGVSMVRNMRIPDGGKAYTNNLLDGFAVQSPLNQNFTFVDQFNPRDIERLEVIRGPGSVLYPSNGFAGAFNIITKEPSKTPEYWLSQEFGMYDLFRTQGSASGRLTDDLGYIVGMNVLANHNWKERNKQQYSSANGKLVFHPDDVSKLTMRLEHVDWYQESPGSITREQFVQNWQQANPNMLNLYQKFEYLNSMASYKRQFGKDGELEISFSRREKTGIDANPGGGSGASSTTEQHIDHSENNAHVVYRQDFDWLKSRVYVGTDIVNGYQYTEVWNRNVNGFDATTMANSTKYNETGVSPFAQYEFSPLTGLFKGGWSVFDNLRFNFGLRNEDFQQRYQQTTYSTTNSNVGRTIKDGSNNYSRLIKKGGFSFEYQPDHILWFGMADGWLMPNASTNVTATYANPNVEPESSLTKQLGLRGFFRKQGLSYDLTAYETNIDNYIGSILCSDNPGACQGWSALPDFIVRGTGRNAVRTVNTAKTTAAYTGNAGKVTARGFETALSFQPHEMIKFDVAHTLTWNVWNTYNAGAVKLSGVTLVNSPKHHVNGRVTVFPVEGLRVEFEGDYLSRYNTNVQNTNTYSRPMLFNLRGAYTYKDWTLSLQALNLFNAKYSSRVTANAQNVQSYTGLAGGTGDAPFTFRAGIEYKF